MTLCVMSCQFLEFSWFLLFYDVFLHYMLWCVQWIVLSPSFSLFLFSSFWSSALRLLHDKILSYLILSYLILSYLILISLLSCSLVFNPRPFLHLLLNFRCYWLSFTDISPKPPFHLYLFLCFISCRREQQGEQILGGLHGETGVGQSTAWCSFSPSRGHEQRNG